jgi:hypothetical protein
MFQRAPYRKLKKQAAARGHSIRELVLAGVRTILLKVSEGRPDQRTDL